MAMNVYWKCKSPTLAPLEKLTRSLDTAGVEQFIAMRYLHKIDEGWGIDSLVIIKCETGRGLS